MCVVLFFGLRKVGPFLKFLAGRYIVDFVNKTSRDKSGACANEKRKRCNRILPDNTLGRNYPSVEHSSDI